MARLTVHYADNETNNILKRLHNKLRPAGTPVQRVEYIIELLLLRIFEVKLKRDPVFEPLRKLFKGENEERLFYSLTNLTGDQALKKLNESFFPFYSKILSHARKVFKENPPQKVLDQLVLIEEVFDNSSFTANVKGGMLHEILGLVEELDEERLLHTDLLGDAIESALSETGGTRDIGLYRTPDHIRQLMVTMVDPQFNDVIFDPACGTGGFLFDSFQYVIERVTKDGKWPGPKTHPELQEYFKNYFAQFNGKMPTADTANAFYRNGVGGIEYLGMIRKMAAVNLFIRGLNPNNIEQGDSLKMFNPASDAGSKSIVIANPPFGAERDQSAYPNVWEEYSKESETTILFVKLMFDLLKKGGRCAVIVSEGFLTWDQSSAKALRKMLLDEANLKAIISLPQGVFVSKGGQGAKTSILYFEKGEPTKQVWFYKIENDGYTMGVNRKPASGSQIPEIIDLFTKHVREGIFPPETKNRFAIPAEWIKTLDPRIKERIRNDTRERLTIRSKEKRNALVLTLDERLAKGRIDEKTKQQKLWEFDTSLESRIQNEIAKNIDKAYAYSLNLTNYRSGLREEQIQEWKSICHCEKPEEALNVLDKLYEELHASDPARAQGIICSLDPKNALEMDIAREYLRKNSELSNGLLKLNKILSSGFKYPKVVLRELIQVNEEKIDPSAYPDTDFIVLGVSNANGVFLNEKKKGGEINQTYYKVYKNQFCYNPYRVNVGSIGLNALDFDKQIISGAYNVFGLKESEIDPKYLLCLFESEKFLDYVREFASGGVRMDFKIEYLQNWLIPLPPLDVQRELAEKINRQLQIIKGADTILDNWDVDAHLVLNASFKSFREIFNVDGKIFTDLSAFGNRQYIGGENIESGTGRLQNIKTISELGITGPAYEFKYGQILYSKVRPNLRKACLPDFEGFCSSDIYPLTVNQSLAVPGYALLLLLSDFFAKHTVLFHERAGMPKINRDQLAGIKLPLPDRESQLKVVGQVQKELSTLDGLLLMKTKSVHDIKQYLSEIWSEG